MNTSTNKRWKLDEIDRMIFEDEVRISAVHFHKSLDMMVIVLNTGKAISRRLSEFKRLFKANESQLLQYEISRTGIHWPELDEDLSLRGFLKYEMKKMLTT